MLVAAYDCDARRGAFCYNDLMTREALEMLLERVAAWPDQAQAEFVRSLEDIETRHLGPYRLSDNERKAVQRGLQEMRERKLADDAAVAAMFNRYRA
ncbi:hypothetical protein ACQR1V_10415 [Bradyrhizobium oligotrophicum]|uniref:hypothetical protein n=1 Tax=Bradyrhizobium oligotrophicum TaxID=44255 RepID=UPI003EBBD1F8